MKQTLQHLLSLWQARAPRERQFLAAMAIFICVALLVQGLWSAHGTRAKLHRQIPQLRQQLDNLQRQSGEIRQMQAQAASPAAQEGPALLTAATAAARNAGLTLAANQLQSEGPRQLRLRATLPFDRWLEWAAALQSNSRLRLIHCRIDTPEGAGTSGQAKIDALFALPDPT